MRFRSKYFFSLQLIIFLAILIFPLTFASGTQIVFGPKSYTRPGDGPPQVVSDSFSAVPGANYKLVLTNNGAFDTEDESAADSFVYLNGNSIVGIHNFSQNTTTLEVPVELLDNNSIEVEVRGGAGSSFSIQVESTI